MRAAGQSLISFFIGDYIFLFLFLPIKLLFDYFNNKVQSSKSFDEELNMNSPKLKHISSSGCLYNENYKNIFIKDKDSIYYAING